MSQMLIDCKVILPSVVSKLTTRPNVSIYLHYVTMSVLALDVLDNTLSLSPPSLLLALSRYQFIDSFDSRIYFVHGFLFGSVHEQLLQLGISNAF